MARLIGNVDATGSLTTPNVTINTSYTSLHLPLDSDIADDSQHGHSVTAHGGAAISATQAKFGSKSLYLDGNGDYLTVPHSGEFNFNGSNFSIEAWVYPTALNSNQGVFSKWGSNGSKTLKLTLNSSGNVVLQASKDGSTGSQISVTSSAACALNTWTHIAATRSGNVYTVYVNGLLSGTQTVSGDLYQSNSNVGIGANRADQNTNLFTGYIDDLLCIVAFAKAYGSAPTAASGGGVLVTTNDTRTFSSVWNLNSPEVTEAFKAGTWPNLVTTQAVTVQVFGAGGAGGAQNAGNRGGNGGIVKAQKTLNVGTVLKIVVGNGGVGWAQANTGLLQGNTSDPMRGGDIYSDESNQTGGQGGSASGVFVTSVTHGNAQVIAGGGGGGAGNASARGGDSHSGTSASDSLDGEDATGNSSYRGQGATTSAGGSANGNGSGAGAALVGGYSGTSSSTAASNYNSGGSGGGGFYGGSGAGHGGGSGQQAGGGAGSGYVDSSWTRLSASGMTPKAGSSNASDNPDDGADGAVIVTDGAGDTTYSTPGTYDHTVS